MVRNAQELTSCAQSVSEEIHSPLQVANIDLSSQHVTESRVFLDMPTNVVERLAVRFVPIGTLGTGPSMRLCQYPILDTYHNFSSTSSFWKPLDDPGRVQPVSGSDLCS
eukprot:g21981.t1